MSSRSLREFEIPGQLRYSKQQSEYRQVAYFQVSPAQIECTRASSRADTIGLSGIEDLGTTCLGKGQSVVHSDKQLKTECPAMQRKYFEFGGKAGTS